MIKRMWHNYLDWEEFKYGMWKSIPKKDEHECVFETVEFMKQLDTWKEFMVKVTKEWTYSCEQNLSHNGINQTAWIGKAACCLAIGTPEHITRKAWWLLSIEEQKIANENAKNAIKEYVSMRWKNV